MQTTFVWQNDAAISASLFRDGTAAIGDELVLDHTHRIRGTHALQQSLEV
jgi:hypothetical protein